MSTLTATQRTELIAAAFQAKEGSYSPYSKFRVGAAFLSSNDEIIKGANIENASYGELLLVSIGGTICAERTALVKAVSEGIKSFKALAVVTDVNEAISPCGMCRQFIREFCALGMPVLMVPADYSAEHPTGRSDGSGKIIDITFGELLPLSFGPEHLELPRGGSSAP
ncbi:cytidine deaminase [Clavulina sp. PMI_390]|nr:cytidine deaminase [Clavulina sp. PMI_390]